MKLLDTAMRLLLGSVFVAVLGIPMGATADAADERNQALPHNLEQGLWCAEMADGSILAQRFGSDGTMIVAKIVEGEVKLAFECKYTYEGDKLTLLDNGKALKFKLIWHDAHTLTMQSKELGNLRLTNRPAAEILGNSQAKPQESTVPNQRKLMDKPSLPAPRKIG